MSIDYKDFNGFLGCHQIIGMSVELELAERLPEAQRTKSRLGSQRESQQFGIHSPKLLCAVPPSDLMVFRMKLLNSYATPITADSLAGTIRIIPGSEF